MAQGNPMGKWWWNAQRFGLTPSKVLSRMTTRQGPRIVSNSLPKAGTHLLERALCQHPRIYRAPVRTLHRRTITAHSDLTARIAGLGPNQLLVTHLDHTEEREKLLSLPHLRSLFMVRDPRDIVISQAHFISGRDQHAHHALFAGTSDLASRYRLVIEGSPDQGFPSLRSRLESYAGWLTSNSLLIRYEDLIGVDGGGDHYRQDETLTAIFEHLGLDLSPDEVRTLAAKVFSATSPTFRRGSAGQWQSQFDDATTELFEGEVGALAARYGYPAQKSTRLLTEDVDADK